MAINPQNDVDEEGFQNFEPISPYDAPNVLLTQMYDGESSLGRTVRTFFNQESLSPKERDSFAQRMKKQYGGNAVLDSTIDIALNPLVWFLALTSPVTAKHFMKSGGKFMGGRSGVTKGAGKIVDAMRGLGMLGIGVGAEHSVTQRAFTFMGNATHALNEKIRLYEGAERGAMHEHNAKVTGTNDLEHHKLTGQKRAQLEYLTAYGKVRSAGMFENSAFKITPDYVKDLPRVTKVKNLITGVEEVVVLPAQRIGEGNRLYKVGSEHNFNETLGSGGHVKILEEPIVVNSVESYQEAYKKLGRRFDLKTITAHGSTPVTFLPVTSEQAEAGLRSMGWDPKIVNAHFDAQAKTKRYLINQGVGETPLGLDTPPPNVGEFRSSTKKTDWISQNHSAASESMDSILTKKQRENLSTLTGSLTGELIPDWVHEGVAAGVIPISEVHKITRQVYNEQLNAVNYSTNITSNNWRLDKGAAKRVEPFDLDFVVGDSVQNFESGTRMARPVLLKHTDESRPVHIDPTDLESFLNVVRPHLSNAQNKAFENKIQRTRDYIQEGVKGNNVVRVAPLDAEREHRAYVADMSGHIVTNTWEPPKELQSGLREALNTKSRNQLKNPEVRKSIELGEDSTLRKRTLEQLGIEPDINGKILFQHGAYDKPLKLQLATRTLLGELSEVSEKILKATTKEEAGFYLRERDKLRSEYSFVQNYKTPHVSAAQSPRNMVEFMQVLTPIENQETREQIKGYIMPRLFGGIKSNHVVLMKTLQATKNTAQSFIEGSVGNFVKNNLGAPGKGLYDAAEAHAKRPIYFQDAVDLNKNMAGYLYSTHLSSLMTGMYNATQPLTWASAEFGLGRVLKAYPQAVKQMWNYAKERSQLGFRSIDPASKDALLKKHIRHTNYNGYDLTNLLGGDFTSTLDSAVASSRLYSKPGLAKDVFINWPLKFFQKVEELNRVVVAELGVDFYKANLAKTGLKKSTQFIAEEIQGIQSHVNFTGSVGSKPRMLADPNSFAGRFLSNNLFGQLLQYPIRFISNIGTSAQVFGGTKTFGLQNFGGPELFEMPAQLATFGRLLGVSAIVYEIGKNGAGVDLSPGLGAQSALGAGRIFTGNFLPPALDIPIKAINSLMDSDKTELRRQLFRVAPAGLPLYKALGSLPAIPGGGPFGALQSQYADWKNPDANGNIPVYKDDGSLQSMDSPLSLVMRGVGFDAKKFASPQDASKFLMANRQEIIALKRQYKDAILGNNYAGASKIENEYKTRFGMGITVKNAEWDQAIKMREVGLAERLVDTLPSDVRNQYQQSLGEPLNERMGLQQSGLQSADTSKQRSSLRAFSSGLTRPEIPADDSVG